MSSVASPGISARQLHIGPRAVRADVSGNEILDIIIRLLILISGGDDDNTAVIVGVLIPVLVVAIVVVVAVVVWKRYCR